MKNFLKRMFCMALAMATCFTLAACGDDNRAVQVDVQPDVLPAEDLINENPAAQQAAQAANEFAFRFSENMLVNTQTGENFICSPYSAYLPLAALMNATQQEYHPALLEALSSTGLDAETLNLAAARMQYSLMKAYQGEYSDAYHNPLEIANAIFISDILTLRDDFAKTFATYYGGAVIPVDFASADAVTAVNNWASEKTRGLITEIIQEFSQDTVAAVANAIYFSDNWKVEFSQEATAEGVFHAPGGDVSAMFMTKDGEQVPYYEDDTMQMVNIPFETGGGFCVFLPKDVTPEELLMGMDGQTFQGLLAQTRPGTVHLLLPRFKIESEVMNLNDALIAMGVPLFDKDAAALTGGLVKEDIELYVSSIVQRAVIDVTEEGTTAAAVTVIGVETSSLPLPGDDFEMICDKPFAFVLYDNTMDAGPQVLFVGVLNNPA
ncbi:hypothetical protein LJB77_01125 [Ruminococcaceae bacterium OttesenSCG-928-N02]|nr:hypothetical protein [Ruminococcaceae bacterium OttesenSCG-928-N02]